MNTTVQNFYATRVTELKAHVIEQVNNFFSQGGLGVPMRLLAGFFAEFSDQIRVPEEEEGLRRDWIADRVFEGTQLMVALAELYETNEELRAVESKMEEAV